MFVSNGTLSNAPKTFNKFKNIAMILNIIESYSYSQPPKFAGHNRILHKTLPVTMLKYAWPA